LFGFAVGWGLRSAYYDFWRKQRRKNKWKQIRELDVLLADTSRKFM
jgi:hypothetical protein